MKRIYGLAILLGLVLVACHPSPDTNVNNPAGGLWLSQAELNTLGAVPSYVVTNANKTINNTDGAEIICSNDFNNSQNVLAAGIVAAKNDSAAARTAVRNAIADVIGSEDSCSDNRQLGISRKLPGYVWGADLANLRVVDPTLNNQFSDWIWYLLNVNDGQSGCGTTGGDGGPGIIGCHLHRSHNWGTVAGVARVVGNHYIAVNDPDQAHRERSVGDVIFRADRTDAKRVVQGQFDTSVYNGFGDRHADNKHACVPSTFASSGEPVNGPGECPKGSLGLSWDGGIPEDLDRGTRTPGTCTGTIDGHAWGAGNYATGEIYALYRFHKTRHEDDDANAIRAWANDGGERVLSFFNRLSFACGKAGNYPEGDDQPWPFLVNNLYGTAYPEDSASATGKVYSYTDYMPQMP